MSAGRRPAPERQGDDPTGGGAGNEVEAVADADAEVVPEAGEDMRGEQRFHAAAVQREDLEAGRRVVRKRRSIHGGRLPLGGSE
jgi:hypothetical protein